MEARSQLRHRPAFLWEQLLCFNSRLASTRRQTLPRQAALLASDTRLGESTSTRIVLIKTQEDNHVEIARHCGSVTSYGHHPDFHIAHVGNGTGRLIRTASGRLHVG